MDYRVVVTEDAENDLHNYVQYLLYVKKNPQAARNILNDFDITKTRLKTVAGNLKYCDNSLKREWIS